MQIHKARNPSLWCPVTVPTGRKLIVDETHPLSQGLIHYFIIMNGVPMDLVQGTPIDIGGASHSLKIDARGPAIGIDGNNIETYWGSNNPDCIMGTNDFSLVAATEVVTQATGGGVGIMYGGQFGDFGAYLWLANGNVFDGPNRVIGGFAASDGYYDYVSTDGLTNGYHTVGMYQKYGSGGATVVDGVQASGFYANTASPNSGTARIRVGPADYINTQNGNIYWAGLWKRALSIPEFARLHVDPYCFLIPEG